MATYATGITATWDNVKFGEVTEIKVTHGGAMPLARTSTWTLDVGTIDLVCLATENVSTSKYGKRAAVSIAGGGMTYAGNAVLEKFTLAGVVNDVARYTVTLKIQP